MGCSKKISLQLKTLYVLNSIFSINAGGVSGSLSFLWYCLFFGGKKIPDLMRGIGRGVRDSMMPRIM